VADPRGSVPTKTRAFGLPQHPDDHCPERPVLLAGDQQLGEGPALRVSELADPLDAWKKQQIKSSWNGCHDSSMPLQWPISLSLGQVLLLSPSPAS
jgi:hypothetical protein